VRRQPNRYPDRLPGWPTPANRARRESNHPGTPGPPAGTRRLALHRRVAPARWHCFSRPT